MLRDYQQAVVRKYGEQARFYLVFHGGFGSTLAEIHEAVDYGVVKMNIDTDMQYAFIRPIADQFFKNYDGVLRVDGEIGSKKAYDPRTYLTLAETTMAARVKQAVSDLRDGDNAVWVIPKPQAPSQECQAQCSWSKSLNTFSQRCFDFLQNEMQTMKVKFYGTRGSLPVCEREFQLFGGNTTCQLLTARNNNVAILDAGSGIRNLGKDLIAKGHQQLGNIYIGFSHFHWDHIQGFPFFLPAYDSRRHFTLSAIGKNRSAKNLRGIFATQMLPDYFPVALDEMGATFSFHQSETDHFITNGVNVRVAEHNHPGGTYGYRIEDTDGKVLAYCTDVEHGDEIDQRVVELASDADLLIHDAQYTPKELKSKKGWGHSSWEQALEVAERAGVKQLALTHHDPDHDDEFLLQIEEICQKRFPNAFLAREQMEIEF